MGCSRRGEGAGDCEVDSATPDSVDFLAFLGGRGALRGSSSSSSSHFDFFREVEVEVEPDEQESVSGIARETVDLGRSPSLDDIGTLHQIDVGFVCRYPVQSCFGLPHY